MVMYLYGDVPNKIILWVARHPPPIRLETRSGGVCYREKAVVCIIMGFQIRPLQEFLVSPALPPALSRLGELANNLLWSWDHNVRTLFRRLDAQLWRTCEHNAVLMLGRIPQAALDKAAADPRFVALYRRACERYDAYLQSATDIYQRKGAMLIAYFSMEYGLVESLPIYSGGLGILSGDHLKGASDAKLPLVAVGLLYQKGYLQQYLNPDGWQTERNAENDFYTWPVQPVQDENGQDVLVSVELPTGTAWIKVWRMNVGRVSLFLLDTNIPQNTISEHRDITDQLYGGDIHVRIRQEIVLGIGGLRALRTMGLDPTVFHMNEGHSAFLALERMRTMMRDYGTTFEEAFDATRTNNIFTTHTAVPAGIDLFDSGLIHEYFHRYCEESGMPFDRLVGLGRRNPFDPHERFSMAILALTCSSYRNAVSRLHCEVSQEMFQDLWPNLPVWEVPITPVTNGIHLPTWLNGDLAMLYDQYLQPDWREQYPEHNVWDHIADIPNGELWEAQKRRKRQLVTFVRERLLQRAQRRRASAVEMKRLSEILDPDAFTIGFARRFATYKRATLLFRDIARLKKLVCNPAMPVQILVAGKAHPKDHPGKQFIREIVQLSRDPDLQKHIVFIEDYDIQVGRELYHGVDLWLNNPRRGEEACGTSGMKAGINGKLNLSVLDGWFDEAYEASGGWAIGDRSPYSEDQDEIHATDIYSQLENEIVPMYFRNRDEGVPVAWIQRMKQGLMHVSAKFNSQRMIGDYNSRTYEPAHQAYMKVRQDQFEYAREKARWSAGVERVWERVALRPGITLKSPGLLSGHPIVLEAFADLSGLSAEDVRVEAVVGRVGISGSLEDTTVLSLPYTGEQDGQFRYAREFVPHQTGRLGWSLRISPNHTDDPLTRPTHARIKWA